MSTTKQNSSVSTVTSSPVFGFVLSQSHLSCEDGFTVITKDVTTPQQAFRCTTQLVNTFSIQTMRLIFHMVCGGILNGHSVANLPLNVSVKNCRKSINICRSYQDTKVDGLLTFILDFFNFLLEF